MLGPAPGDVEEGGGVPVRVLAMYAQSPRDRWRRPWRTPTGIWHAVTESTPAPTLTVCGRPITSEAYRTWEQAPTEGRCPDCQRAVAAVLGSEDGRVVPPVPSHGPPVVEGNAVNQT